MSSYYQNLIKRVIDLSYADNWKDAVKEWCIFDCDEDELASSTCVCGKEDIRYLFTIKNNINGNMLYPIGSSCINKFNRKTLKDEVRVYEDMFKLLHAIENNDFIQLSSDFFSRKILLKLYNDGAFIDTVYNCYNGENDYKFLLDMFNKRNKEDISTHQKKKISAIITCSIKPFLIKKLKNKNKIKNKIAW